MQKQNNQFLKRKLNKLYLSISHPYSFVLMVILLVSWFITGYFMHYDEHWFKIIHLFEITVTLLVIFIIETTQHADMKAMHEKLDELLTKLPHTDSKKARIEKRYKGEEKH